eukprot:15466107-Alexandrium_andersonii.AAC.1
MANRHGSLGEVFVSEWTSAQTCLRNRVSTSGGSQIAMHGQLPTDRWKSARARARLTGQAPLADRRQRRSPSY